VHAIIVEALEREGALPNAEWLRHSGRDDDSRWCLMICRNGSISLLPGPDSDKVGSAVNIGDEHSRGIDLVVLSRVLSEPRTEVILERLINALATDHADAVKTAMSKLSQRLSEAAINGPQ